MKYGSLKRTKDEKTTTINKLLYVEVNIVSL